MADVAEWVPAVVAALIAVVVVGVVSIFVGLAIIRDAHAGRDHEFNRARKRSGRRFTIVGEFMAVIGVIVLVCIAAA